jgi:hypothetical protein
MKRFLEMLLTCNSSFQKKVNKFLTATSVKGLLYHEVLTRIIVLITIYNLALLSLHLAIKPFWWFFDDSFVVENGLIHYVDFRPGYPPLGKLPYTLLYVFFKCNPIPQIIYNILILDIVLYVLYKMLSNLMFPKRAAILTMTVAINPTIIWITVCNNHADLLALLFMLLSINAIAKEKVFNVGVYCGLGFLTKIYPAILLIPAFFKYNLKGKTVLVSTFMLSVMLVSLPFLMVDPLMYASTFVHHLLRGPSESVLALLDGYYSHTGFLHPTYEATLYTWQFSEIYQPSSHDHFRYEWNNPYLRYISPMLQLGLFLLFSLISKKGLSEVETVENTSLTALVYFALSAFWNPLVALPVFLLVIFSTLGRSLAYQLLMITLFATVDFLHCLSWFPRLPLGIELSLIVVVSLRATLLSTLFITCLPR